MAPIWGNENDSESLADSGAFLETSAGTEQPSGREEVRYGDGQALPHSGWARG